jgi:hypothetical protein
MEKNLAGSDKLPQLPQKRFMSDRSRRRVRRQPIISHLFAGLLYCGIWFAFYLCLTSTLDEMTRRDCHRGVRSACAALKSQ